MKSNDCLLTLAGMYGCYVIGFEEPLDTLQRFFLVDSEDPDVVILRHAYAMKFPGTPRRLQSCR